MLRISPSVPFHVFLGAMRFKPTPKPLAEAS